MRLTSFLLSAAGLLVVGLICANPAQAALKGLWEFEDGGDLTAATVGADLTLTNPNLTEVAVPGSGGIDTGAAQLGVGDYYTVTNGVAPNGGGSFVNQYTLLFDVSYPTAGIWRTLFQTNTTNGNDGDYFIHPDDESWGVGALGYTDGFAGTFSSSANTWYRAVLTVDLGNAIKIYIDGNYVGDHNADSVDGRFSLENVYHLLADNDGDDGLLNISNFAIWDSALGPNEVGALGGAGREIPIPEPSSAILALVAVAGLLSTRRRR